MSDRPPKMRVPFRDKPARGVGRPKNRIVEIGFDLGYYTTPYNWVLVEWKAQNAGSIMRDETVMRRPGDFGYWRVLGYHPHLQGVLREALNVAGRRYKAEDLADLQQHLDIVLSRLAHLVDMFK